MAGPTHVHIVHMLLCAGNAPGTATVSPWQSTLPGSHWRPLARMHRQAVCQILGLDTHLKHNALDPIQNFICEYYSWSPRRLLQWSPGLGTALGDVVVGDFGHTLPSAEKVAMKGGRCSLRFDPTPETRRTWANALDVMRACHHAPPNFRCYGLHEWAMLYYPKGAEHHSPPMRHQSLPLRVRQDQLNAVVEKCPLECTHFDAWRHFAEEAKGLNAAQLSRATQARHEQPACVHAAMDLFKWTVKAFPFAPSSFVTRSLEIAIVARVIDMRASPYDLSAWKGAGSLNTLPIRVETVAGRQEYAHHQQRLMARAAPLRLELIRLYEELLARPSARAVDHIPSSVRPLTG